MKQSTIIKSIIVLFFLVILSACTPLNDICIQQSPTLYKSRVNDSTIAYNLEGNLIFKDCVYDQSKTGENLIDTRCLSTYEDACIYLTEKGYLTTQNGRIYKLKEAEIY